MTEWSWQQPEWPNLTYDASALQGHFERVTLKAGYLAGVRSSLSEEDQTHTLLNELTEETVQSHAIEGEKLDPRHVRNSLLASLNARDANVTPTRSDATYHNLAEVMLDARLGNDPMTIERINRWHVKLFHNDRRMPEIGKFRSDKDGPMQVVSTDRYGQVKEIHFQAPPASRLNAEMSAFTEWLNQTSPRGEQANTLTTPGRAALSHLRFETIHPYADGNGRIGRALADYVSAQSPTFAKAPFSLSRAILADKKSYYDPFTIGQKPLPVTATGQLDATHFVESFTSLMNTAIDRSAEMAIHINHRNVFFHRHAVRLNKNQARVLSTLFERGPERLAEGISPRWYNRTADVSRQTASRDLSDLVSMGALTGPHGAGSATKYHISATPPRTQTPPNVEQFTKIAKMISDDQRRQRAMSLIAKIGAAHEQPGNPTPQPTDDTPDFDIEP